jgi:hypothetical protein
MRMINRTLGQVVAILVAYPDLLKLLVTIEGEPEPQKAYAFPKECGPLQVGDWVLLNTTAVDLGLGSGGYHFVIGSCPLAPAQSTAEHCAAGINVAGDIVKEQKKAAPGHIMKLRYTPYQLKVCAVEEEDSPAHQQLKKADRLQGLPVIAGSLHSMLVPCVCGIKAVREELRVAYVMTDGGALPLAMSEAVRSLRQMGLLCGTITVGHAYGGDLEAVNLYSGLLAAQVVLQADVVVVLMGPGVVGTNTKWGTTALELGQIINAVHALGGIPYTIPRLSLADGRKRHHGISHHTITALNEVSLAVTRLVLPTLDGPTKAYFQKQLQKLNPAKYRLVWGQGQAGIRLAQELTLPLASMGRSYAEDPAFFLAASAAGEVTARELTSGEIPV